ncbi:MAG: sugar isomerase [Myxococcota bacterium]|nr:sugar isomerase [Myxococcota bacterium]
MRRENISYQRFALVREMVETIKVIENFNPEVVKPFVEQIDATSGIMLSGEGSSRIFPAKNAIYLSMKLGALLPIITESGRQAMEYDLSNWTVFGASNSGKTRETLSLMRHLKILGNRCRFGVTAGRDTPLGQLCERTHILSCGEENAVAATKSVVEQGLFYHAIIRDLLGCPISTPELRSIAQRVQSALEMPIPPTIVEKMSRARRVYFAGRNNGVAEELALKASEIVRISSDYLENTYAVHGVEEVMTSDEMVVVIDPYEEELEKFQEVLVNGVGLTLIAIASEPLTIPTIVLQRSGEFDAYVQLAAGWNLLVETGLNCQVDMDRPERARKIGNEFF